MEENSYMNSSILLETSLDFVSSLIFFAFIVNLFKYLTTFGFNSASN